MRRIMPLLLFALLCTLLPGASPAQAAPANAAPHELLLTLESGLAISPAAFASGPGANRINTLLRQAGANQAHALGAGSQTYRLKVVTPLLPLLARLAATPGVRAAEPNYRRTAMRTSNDPVLRQQWALRNIQAPEAWDITTGTGVTIALLDTGVARKHPDLRGKLLPGYDFHNRDDNPEDDDGHGTYTAGVAAADSNNEEGIAGVCWGCNILPVKVLGAGGTGDDAAIAEGIRWAVDQGARIVSMSLGGPEDTQAMRDAVAYARDRNVLLIAASGNGQAEGNAPNYPAAYPDVLAVAATDGSDVVTGFSTTGDFVDITAPGVGVWSTGWEDGRNTYMASNGTSAACPHVAGVAGLMLSVRPDLSATQLAELLTRSSDDRGAPGKDATNGHGRLNALRAVQFAADPAIGAQAAPAPAAPVAAPAFAAVPAPNDPASAYFGETGHTLRGAFRSFWERNGGLAIFGFPISEEFIERGDDGRDYTVQYFERHRLEFHPENPAPYNVLLGRMGADQLAQQGRDWFGFAKDGAQNGCRFFPETGHSVCGAVLRAWRAGGLELDGRRGKTEAENLALFGMPLSGLLTETLADGRQYQVQWFERARFELHPENAAPYDVLLGLLAADLARSRGWR